MIIRVTTGTTSRCLCVWRLEINNVRGTMPRVIQSISTKRSASSVSVANITSTTNTASDTRDVNHKHNARIAVASSKRSLKTFISNLFSHKRSNHLTLSATPHPLSCGAAADGKNGASKPLAYMSLAIITMTLLTAAVINIYNIPVTYATDATDTKSLDFSVTSEKSIGITIPSEPLALAIQPTATGQFGRVSADIVVSTNNYTGYTLTMQASTDTLTRSAQVNNTTYTINPLTQSITCSTETDSTCTGWTSSLANNEWGYRLSTDSSYSAITSAVSSAANLKTTSSNSNSDTTTLYFATKLDNNIPTGNYTGVTLTFVAVTNYTPAESINDLEYLQDFATLTAAQQTLIANSMTENQAYSLKDNRDEQSYYIAKLADGNIWFLDNLRLDLTNSTVQTNLTSATTNATDTSLNCLTGRTTGCSSPYTTAAVSESIVNGGIIVAYNSTTYKDYVDSNALNNWGNGSHKYGVLYNYCAASAGSTCDTTDNASEDICPAGWRMPTGNSTGEWGVLKTTINNNTASNSASIQAVLSLPLSGYYSRNESADYQGSRGYWWSSTRYGSSRYVFYATATGTYATLRYEPSYGLSMRCLFTPPKTIDDVSTLQDFASLSADDKQSVLDSMTENTVYQKTDSRDGETYNIAKLADGNIWFLDNLRLDLTDSTVKTNLTSATTNATDTSLGYLKNGSGSSPYATAAVAEGMTADYTKPYISTTYKTTINSDSTKNWGNGSHMYGVLYNYCAASAGSYCMSSSTTTDGDGSGNANQDICPAGWRMPTGNSTGEWGALDSLINNNTASNSASIQARLSLPLSGFFVDGSADNQGSYGGWWSSTRSNGGYMYYFGASATGTGATYLSYRLYGTSMRCLFSAS